MTELKYLVLMSLERWSFIEAKGYGCGSTRFVLFGICRVFFVLDEVEFWSRHSSSQEKVLVKTEIEKDAGPLDMRLTFIPHS